MAKLAYDLNAHDSRGFTRTNMFTIIIERIPHLDLFVASVSGLPGYQVNVLTVNWRNEPAKMAERPELGDISLVVHDNIEKETAKNIYSWFTQVYDPITKRVGVPSEYKCDGELSQMDSKGNVVYRWKLEGLWPSSVDLGDLSYENAALVEITVTLQADRVYLL